MKFENLPNEILYKIFSNVDLREFSKLLSLNKKFNEFFKDEYLWKFKHEELYKKMNSKSLVATFLYKY